MGRLERGLQASGGERRDREMRLWPDREPPREILRRLEELSHETEFLLQGLADQQLGRNDETNMLYNRMRELNEQMQQARQQLGQQFKGPGRQRMEFRQEVPEEKLQNMEELGERVRQIELELYELSGGSPERVLMLAKQLHEIRMRIKQNEREPDLQRELGAMRQDRLRELQDRAHKLENKLQVITDNHPEAQKLRMQLDKIHQQMERIERKRWWI